MLLSLLLLLLLAAIHSPLMWREKKNHCHSSNEQYHFSNGFHAILMFVCFGVTTQTKQKKKWNEFFAHFSSSVTSATKCKTGSYIFSISPINRYFFWKRRKFGHTKCRMELAKMFSICFLSPRQKKNEESFSAFSIALPLRSYVCFSISFA